MNYSPYITTLVIVTLNALINTGCAKNEDIFLLTDDAKYSVKFTATWSNDSHPDNFPTKPHFSRLIGATHNESAQIWQLGSTSSEGVKLIAEQGSGDTLVNEINLNDNMHILIVAEQIKSSPGYIEYEFNINIEYPLVSLISMIAPSPDWFVGVDSISLIENNNWVEEKTISLTLFDAGTDSGESYSSQNENTNPTELISKLEASDIGVNEGLPAVGTLIFSRID